VIFHIVCRNWVGAPNGQFMSVGELIQHPGAPALLGSLLGIAVSGGMFVVPLYAFLTTSVPKSETARTVAANNIVNSGAMVIGSLLALALSKMGVAVVDQLLFSAGMCLFSAWLGYQLHRACDPH
jgi:MFS family permease